MKRGSDGVNERDREKWASLQSKIRQKVYVDKFIK